MLQKSVFQLCNFFLHAKKSVWEHGYYICCSAVYHDTVHSNRKIIILIYCYRWRWSGWKWPRQLVSKNLKLYISLYFITFKVHIFSTVIMFGKKNVQFLTNSFAKSSFSPFHPGKVIIITANVKKLSEQTFFLHWLFT